MVGIALSVKMNTFFLQCSALDCVLSHLCSLTLAADPRKGVLISLTTRYPASLSLPVGGVTIIMVSRGDTERTKFMSRT